MKKKEADRADNDHVKLVRLLEAYTPLERQKFLNKPGNVHDDCLFKTF